VNPTNGNTPPTGLVRGAFYEGPANDSRIWTFGGSSFRGNTSFPGYTPLQSDATPLWSFDTVAKEWDAYATTLDEQPNYGLSAEASDQGLAFYLNGQIDNGTQYTTDWLGNNTLNLPGMVVIDLLNQSFANVSTPGLNDSTYPRVGGSMQYVPDVGRNGILVALGGAYRQESGPGKFADQTLVRKMASSSLDLLTPAGDIRQGRCLRYRLLSREPVQQRDLV
jgi:hypothetical protein